MLALRPIAASAGFHTPIASSRSFMPLLRWGAADTTDSLSSSTPGRWPEHSVLSGDTPAIRFWLKPGESIKAEPGALLMMDGKIEMDTQIAGGIQRGAEKGGLLKGILQGGKRLLAGENLFITTFTAHHPGGELHLAAPYPGTIVPLDLSRTGPIRCQRGAFLASTPGVSTELSWVGNIGAGFLGGEGFTMQRLSGKGKAFVHAGGQVLALDLKPGEVRKIDTGCLVAMDDRVHYEVEWVRSLRNLFANEGVALAKVTGPGRIYVQTMPFSRFSRQVDNRAGGDRTSGGGSLLANIGGDLLAGALTSGD